MLTFKTVGKCIYCKDPIYSFQEVVTVRGDEYHSGCADIEDGEKE